MVITSSSPTKADGQAHQQPVVLEGQETQDPDEPPIPEPRAELQSIGHSTELEKHPEKSAELERKDVAEFGFRTASNSTTSTNHQQDVHQNGDQGTTNESDDPITVQKADRDVPPGGNSRTTSDSGETAISHGAQEHGPWDGNPSTAHSFRGETVAAFLGVDPERGLTTEEGNQRLSREGPNKLKGDGQVSMAAVLLRQVSNSLTIVLLIAMALSYGTLDFIEGAVISAVILLNITLGFIQDYRAEKTMQSLLALSAPNSLVTRSSTPQIIKAENLVIGDIVSLKDGDIVPADIRLLSTTNLEIDEASQTGESLPAGKDASKVIEGGAEVQPADRVNMAFSATTVTHGRASGVVVATGMNTQVGKIAQLMGGKSDVPVSFPRKVWNGIKNILGLTGTPMQIKLSTFAILLFGLAVVLAIIVFSANKWDLDNEVVLYGICVAVAVIPESLIAVMTITMAVGVKAMAKGNVVVRKMAALEAVGGVTNICSDKTGTLTQGKMVACKVWSSEFGMVNIKDTKDYLDPSDCKIEHFGTTYSAEAVLRTIGTDYLGPILATVALCNFASVLKRPTTSESIEKDSATGEWTATGGPTEIALQVLAMRFNYGKEDILSRTDWKSAVEHQFESSKKRMSIAYSNPSQETIEVFAKGAYESMLPIMNISPSTKALLETKLDELAHEGLRVICAAKKTVSVNALEQLKDRTNMESNLGFLGLIAIHDPPRNESLPAVRRCHAAGITVHMLTGDHLTTATSIARTVGILPAATLQTSRQVMQASTFDTLSNDEVDALPSLPLVLARCTPETKVRMVKALRRRNAFSVMTGDGVNDAPALLSADVGISMGINGTDVAKSASDMVLTDDNFSSIVSAVEEGRRLFDNIQKFLMHLLISNIAQVVLLLVALVFKDGEGNSVFPLSPLGILWVNMVTSSFLALGLGMEEAKGDVMVRPPRDVKVGVFTWELIVDKMLYGTFAGMLCLVSFIIVIYGDGNGNLGINCNEEWNNSCNAVFRGRATVFAVLSFLLLVTAWEVKHFGRSLFNLDPERYHGRGAVFKALTYNRFLLWAIVAGFVITFPVIYIPVVNKTVFKHSIITWEWGLVVGCLVCYVAFVEAWKGIKRRVGLWSGKMAAVEKISA